MTNTALISVQTIALYGFALGILMGFITEKTRFCTMGAIADWVIMNNLTRLRSWVFAVVIAVWGVVFLQMTGLFSIHFSFYTAPRLLWLSHIVGGLMFGIGMVLSGGCGLRLLGRLGGGSLKALIALLVLAVSAEMTIKGMFAIPRTALFDLFAINLPTHQDLPSLLSHVTGLSRHVALITVALPSTLLSLYFCFRDKDFRAQKPILGGLGVGLLIVAGWAITAIVGYTPEHPDTLQEAFIGTRSGRAESFSLIAPLSSILELLIFWTDKSKTVDFGLATALGIIVGAFIHAVINQRFAWDGFTQKQDTTRYIIGAILMGFGGVTAVGCTIGQGLSGLSTLSTGATLTVIAIVIGARWALRRLG